MRSFAFVSALVALGVSANPTKTEKQLPKRAVPAVTASGNAFYANGERFYIRGIDYQPGGSSSEDDPLAETEVCMRDIENFKALGVNTIRVYMVDNSKSHDECMSALAENGIYLVLDLNTPKYSINRKSGPDAHLSYNAAYLQNIFATVDEFVKYDNTLAFFSGNEVINEEPGTTVSAPYVKAVTRDVKAYMKARSYRAVPIGYSAADVSANRMQTAFYMNCGSDNARSDFFAFNDYSWCKTDFETAEWDVKVKNFTDYGLPIFLSEYGCITNGRDFEEIGALMNSEMTGVYSGGLMYEYSMEKSGYGIVEIEDGSVSTLPEFDLFASALSSYPAPTGDGGAAATTHGVPCPTKDSTWEVDPDVVPVMPKKAQKYFDQGAGQGLGFTGPGSQTDGDSGLSETNTTAGESGDGGDNAAMTVGMEWTSMAITGFTLAFTLFGTMLL